ncbi:glycosyltransferase family 4 protein [Acidimicrobiia bacterium EGI L10123]|uniref:glycosyltransferase family 4 protein n=1 Tax=Salinilacustrithrix flava TaxID=2957203 RepID=UPI003D7C1E33|nr:glycosyltransferase family 4 protein [Acidimicrobiia bacterium EGI L10123]
MRVAIPLEQCWAEVPGGTARTMIDLAAALDARPEVDVVGVAARHSGPPPPAWRPTVPVHHLPLPRRLLHETWHALRRPRIERATGAVDVCHAVGGAIPATAAPLVVTVHDLAFVHYPELFSRQGRRFFHRALTLTRAHAAQVQVPSQATLEDCVAAGIERDRLRLVPWGCTVTDPSAEDVAEVTARFGLPGRYVVCVGTLEPRKNLRRLLQAWARLARHDVELVLIGPGGWGEERDLSTSARNVTMTGFVDLRTRDALYRGAVASCYPSLFEGFGLPVLESMALGCPVVTSAGTSTAELAAGGAALTVDPLDVDAIAGALADVLDDADLRARLIEAGSARAGERTWERAAELAVAGYQEVLA